MNSWVISCNPTKYNHAASFKENGFIDWITINDFKVGDTVYIYEVIPPKGRGGIVYKSEVIQASMSIDEKLDDRKFWKNGVYPSDYSGHKFSRLKLIGEVDDDRLSLNTLRDYGFTPPQGLGHLLDKKPTLLKYIEAIF